MPIAGPVFTEWYWTPIFVLVLYGPPIALVAFALYLTTRRTGWRRATRAAAALAAATVLVVAGAAVWRSASFERAEAADARSIGFPVFEARGLHQTRAEVYDGLRPSLILEYEREGRVMWASQRASRGDDVTPPECAVHDGTPQSAYQGPCRTARSPAGRAVTLARTPTPNLFAVRDGTLVVAGSHEATEADLLAFADALRPVPVAELGWER